jgi:hypothetical protein
LTLFLSVDGNFKLKRKARSINDPDLSNGSAYFVKTPIYDDFLKRTPLEKEVVCILSVCDFFDTDHSLGW